MGEDYELAGELFMGWISYRAVFTQIFQNMIDVACENGHFNRHDAT